MVGINGETIDPDPEKRRRRKELDRDVPYFLFSHCAFLWCRIDVGQTDQFGYRGILAMVVVHLWVEGFFEVFATVVMAFLFVRLGLLKPKSATSSVLFFTIIFL